MLNMSLVKHSVTLTPSHGIYRSRIGLRLCWCLYAILYPCRFCLRDGDCIHFNMNMQYRPTCTLIILQSYFATYFVIMYVDWLKFIITRSSVSCFDMQ